MYHNYMKYEGITNMHICGMYWLWNSGLEENKYLTSIVSFKESVLNFDNYIKTASVVNPTKL